MSITIWKWIFEMSTNEVLLQISKKHKIKVPGFRELKLDKTFKIIRPQLIRLMLDNKKIVLIKSDLNKMYENDERLLQFRSKSIEQLFKLIDKENNPCDILVSLLSSGNVEHQNLGETVYSRLLETGKIDEYEKKMVNIRKEGEEVLIKSVNANSKEKVSIDLKKKLQKSEDKNDDLTPKRRT